MPLPTLLAYAPAAISAISSLVGHAGRKKTPSFGNTPYGRYLQKVSEEGMYSPEVEREMVGRVAGQAGNISQIRKAGIRGQLESKGLGNSISGARLLSDPEREQQRTVTDYTSRLDEREGIAKGNALRDFAIGKTQSEGQKRMEDSQAKAKLIGGLGGAAASAAGTMYEQGQLKSLVDKGYPDIRGLSPETVRSLGSYMSDTARAGYYDRQGNAVSNDADFQRNIEEIRRLHSIGDTEGATELYRQVFGRGNTTTPVNTGMPEQQKQLPRSIVENPVY